MDSSTRKTTSGSAKQAALVIQNGRLRGTRRTFGVPTTFLGSGPSCDVRLSLDGISPLHCVIIQANGELILRDLESATGTFVNGQKVTSHTLRNGDQLAIGPFQIQVQIPEGALAGPTELEKESQAVAALEVSSREKVALRIQVAAVAAQQAALTEAECRLHQRQTTLEQQQVQLATHLEEKRTRLSEMQNQVQAARQALQQEREEYNRHVEDVKENLSQTQQELLEEQAEVRSTRKRLAKLHSRLKKRFEKSWSRERRNLDQREKSLETAQDKLRAQSNRLAQEKEQFHARTAKVNSEIELAKRKLQDQRTQFQNEQLQAQEQHVEQSRELQRARQELQLGEQALLRAEQLFRQEKLQAEEYLQLLKDETVGLETRIQHQRELLAEVQESEAPVAQALERREHPATSQPDTPKLPDTNYPLVVPTTASSVVVTQTPEAIDTEHEQPPLSEEIQAKLAELEAVAGDLTDQRAQLLEGWEHFLRVRMRWEEHQQSASREVRELVVQLHKQAQTLLVQEEQLAVTRESVAKRFTELQKVRQQLVAWQSRLKAREVTWEGERDRFLAELRSREEYTAQHLQSLAELRQRWAECRRKEVEAVKTVQEACDKSRLEYLALSEERRHQIQQITEERQTMSTKALAIEQYRQECLTRSNDDAAAERRIGRLRRRWEAAQTAALRATQQENQELETELSQLRARNKDLSERLSQMESDVFAFTNQQAEWQRQQLRANNKQVELQQQVQSLQVQREQATRQISQLEAEIERVAKLLIEEPRTPITLRLPEQALAADQPQGPTNSVDEENDNEEVERAA